MNFYALKGVIFILNFIKMHAAGNDYLYFDCLNSEIKEPERVAKALCPRRFSVGADGIVLIEQSKIADAKMRIFNADGSEAKMCGNAARCVGRLLYESGFVKKSRIRLETLSGVRNIYITVRDGAVGVISADMGMVKAVGEPYFLCAKGEKYEMRAFDVGNLHQVGAVVDVDALPLDEIGRAVEETNLFEDGVNTEFYEVVGKNCIKVRVFERGSGETLSCGTGACAVSLAAILRGDCDGNKPVRVLMRGGELTVSLDENMCAYLTGATQKVFEGTVDM